MNDQKYFRNYINGEWVEAVSGAKREVTTPTNGEIIGTVAEGKQEDAQLAIDAAKFAFYKDGTWRRLDVQKRADALYKIAAAIEERLEEIARLESLDNGKPLREAQEDIGDAVNCFKYYAGLVNKPTGSVYNVNEGFGQMHSYTVHEPVGVCALITPWNYPFLMAAWKIAPALAAGNCIIFKPSSNTPLSSVLLFEIFDKIGLPPGTVNLVMGGGSTVGQELAENVGVDMVTFTGSTSVGQGILRAAAGNLKKVGLELGGKSPNVIFADAEFEGAVEWAMIGIFFNQGEVCSAGSRILIEESLKDRFVARLIERLKLLKIGHPLTDVDMGPLVSKEQLDTVLGYVEIGKAEGAKCVYGGVQYTEGDCAKGYYMVPTIFEECTSDMRIVREEIFGPVVTIQTFKTEEEAVEMANDTDYGLAGAVFTTDGARALRVIKEIRAGITWINCYNPTFNEAPWGGYKMSGIGRELGIHGLHEYQEIKQININLNPGPIGWYPVE